MEHKGSINDVIYKRIRELRKKEGLSQEELARMLNLSRPTITHIENGMRKISVSELVKISNIFHVNMEEIVGGKTPERKSFFDGYSGQPGYWIAGGKTEKGKKKKTNGVFPETDKDKFKEVLLYVLSKAGAMPNVGEGLLYKILFLIDIEFYEKYNEFSIGAVYVKHANGPVPVMFKDIIKEMLENKEVVKLDSRYFAPPQTKYLPLREPDLSKLKASETGVIDGILGRASAMSPEEAENYIGAYPLFRNAALNKKISYGTLT